MGGPQTPACPAHPCKQGYFLARARAHYVQEALLRPLAAGGEGSADAALAAATCALLQETYTAAIDRLTLCGSSHECGAGQECEDPDGSAASEGCELLQGDGGWAGGAGGLPRRAADAGQMEARRRGRAVGDGVGGSKAQQGLAALGRRCLREVQGGLDEVVGLDAIKQARRTGRSGVPGQLALDG